MNHYDLIVLGAGPAGVSAALLAAAKGLRVALFDENSAAGGQVYRAPIMPDAKMDGAEFRAGETLRDELSRSNVCLFLGHTVWAVTGDYRVDALGPAGSMSCTTTVLLVASGTTERVVPFEGWTLPGVIGLAAATILLKSQRTLPGNTTLVAGCGPLLVAVAGNTLKAGGQVKGIVDIASRGEWCSTAAALLSRPAIFKQSLGYGLPILRARVPIYSRHTLVKVTAQGDQLLAELAPCDASARPIAGPTKQILVDCVAVGHGLTPSTDITRLLHAKHDYSREAGGWIAQTDENGQTSRERLFVAGDSAGIRGAAAAIEQGKRVGLACVALIRGETAAASEAENLTKAWQHAARFGQKMAAMMALREGHVESIPQDTVVCRCEDVTRAEIEQACEAGARDVNQLKAWTRCGMGPCQGRTCGDIAAELLANKQGVSRESVGIFSPRTPLRPLTISDMTGDYDYADIPIPKAAPL
ncbi:NAD(P)/FAD-dependent oxidoreductase [Pantoea cypripedii]|uniref:FAD/NAD(P)-binding oxidoreductase n=1 Tax=Pantoea cypripedii TaxID=55209 RepID=A0A1X1EK40_PANCY|nr:NAD(P)/FAD-dependent oxidoreductase [Pantoea cypripedii]MBP2200414.1 NADPH-dependent 2,4-dienoyl-CoA reductase/sulfur reductase-like enzyme [Pantoea cypripedii]ORM89256.1 FAD/NAD(P)-binding oxidoreductase [Pantoea cypripedii]